MVHQLRNKLIIGLNYFGYFNIKLITVITFFFVTFSSCLDDKKPNNLKELHLEGQVKMITSINYDAIEKFGEIEKGKVEEIEKIIFNSNGNKIEEYISTSLFPKFTYIYDKRGNLIEENWYYFNPERLGSKRKFKFDKSGNKIEKNIYNSDGSLYFKETIISKFNGEGKKIEETYINPIRDEITQKYTYKYSDRGSLIEKNDGDFFSDGSSRGDIYKYDVNGNLIETDTYETYGIVRTEFYKYDDKGNVIEKIRYDSDGKIDIKFSYKYDYYDKKGNWLKKVTFENDDIPYEITEREIEYFYE